MITQFKLLTPVTITTAGVRVQVSATTILASCVYIEADASNTGAIYIGDSSVTSTNGNALTAGQSLSITPETVRGSFLDLDISDLYLDTATNGNIARVSYLARK